MNVETKIKLDRFVPRLYQLPIIRALEQQKYRKIVCLMPRRAGKDIMSWNLIIRVALEHIAVYYYIFPTYAQRKKLCNLWRGIFIVK